MNPETMPSMPAKVVEATLKAAGVKCGAWKDRVYLNGYAQNVKAFLIVPDTDAPVISQLELKLWVDNPLDVPWDQINAIKAETMAAIAASLAPFGWVPAEPVAAVAAPSAAPVAAAAAVDSDIPF